jgi:hypothetical protein
MRFRCPYCRSVQELTPPIEPGCKVRCDNCQRFFQWSRDLVTPYCYACLSEDVAVYLKIPRLGFVYACNDHGDVLHEFWLLPMIKLTAASRNHAREYDRSPSGSNTPGGIYARKHVAGK